ncbi:MAG: YggT family protein [Candidatus Goldbacteria bacterium]|nr:YggT family protein [Candidatus Goldiibacteriota bacterium]
MMIVVNLIQTIANIYIFLIIIRALMSWIKSEVLYAYSSFFAFVSLLTDPFLNFIRRFIPLVYHGFDFSPVVAIFIVEILKNTIILLLTKIF